MTSNKQYNTRAGKRNAPVCDDIYSVTNRKALAALFERERREWLDAGMSEAGIFRMHFGDEGGDGRGGDYRVWLSERRHVRADHKYAPGAPVSIDTVDPEGDTISARRSGLEVIDAMIDLEAAMSSLTPLQRSSFAAVRLDGLTQAEAAKALGVSRESVKQAIGGALKKLGRFFL